MAFLFANLIFLFCEPHVLASFVAISFLQYLFPNGDLVSKQSFQLLHLQLVRSVTSCSYSMATWGSCRYLILAQLFAGLLSNSVSCLCTILPLHFHSVVDFRLHLTVNYCIASLDQLAWVSAFVLLINHTITRCSQ